MEKDEIGAIVLEKVHRPSEHNFKYISIDNSIGISESIILTSESSGLWEYIQETDSIYKNSNSSLITVFRDERYKSFKLNYRKKCN